MVSTTASGRPLTVVIPLYDDLDSIRESISSVIRYGDLPNNRLLVVNDCGPRVDEVEAAVLELLDGVEGATYARNPRNLGFVETCNRAVSELETTTNDILLLNSDTRIEPGTLAEMAAVLAMDEKHGVVFPRSDNAAIASVPLLPLHEIGSDETRSRRIYEALRPHLPRYAVTPVAVGFCFLVRRELILNYGLFDPIYSPGYSEENDFCLRVNKYGYSAIMANHAFVHHEGSMSFSDEQKLLLQKRNEERMLSRYPYYRDAVVHYLESAVDPADWFAVPLFAGERPRVLIDLFHMSLIYNGSTRNALSFLDLLVERAPDLDIDFTIVSSAEAIAFFGLESYGFPIVVNGTLEDVYDLGFALSPVSDPSQINLLNRHCVRWVVSHFDVIALRINSLLEVSYARRQIVLDSLRYSDRVIPLSAAGLDDIEAYFGPEAAGVREHSTVVHDGVAPISFEEKEGEAPGLTPEVRAVVDAGGYVLVIGNIFTHKQLPETLTALAGFDAAPVIGFGAIPGAVPAGMLFIEGGWLSDQLIDRLYRKAAVVVFPSSYEGFGLPMAEAGQRGTPVVVWDTRVAHEVADSLGIADLTSYFDRFDRLPAIVAAAMTDPSTRTARELRPLSAYNAGILDLIVEELARPVDIPRLRTRVAYFRGIRAYSDVVERRLGAIVGSGLYKIFVRVAPFAEPLRPAARTVRSVVRRVRARRSAPRS